ncbi:alpha/beta hydrolase [Amphritea sp. HPY]|uniref:alpha/beta hydrolase n=1 Tax=Amphritea sp. HPY TaxID=3421652 RepID=UPI003D7E4033
MKGLRTLIPAVVILLVLSGCSEHIVNRIAFHPIPFQTSDYEITDKRIQELEFTTPDQVRLHAFYIPYPGKQKLVVFFHGNFGNSLHRIFAAWELAKTGVNVMLISYRGYGRSEGIPTEKGLYTDAATAINFATNQLGYNQSNIFILGRSLGTAVAIDVAQDLDLGGLILISPFPSGNAVMETSGAGWLSWFVTGTPFNSAEKIHHAKVPALFIHGDRDTLIPVHLSRELYRSYPSPYKSMVTVPTAGHNDIFSVAGTKLWSRIGAFVESPQKDMDRIENL